MKNRSKILLALLIVLTLMVGMFTITASAAGSTRVYLDNDAGWSNVYCYYWNASSNNGWPGGLMSYDDDLGYYYFDIPSGYTMCIFNNGSGTQTADLAVPTGEYVIFNNSSNKWFNSDGVADVPPYTVAGSNSSNKASIFGTAWDTTNTANDMTYDTSTNTYVKVYEGVPSGSYKFKCVKDHSWAVAYPSADKWVTVSTTGSRLTITLNGSNVSTKVETPTAKVGSKYYYDGQAAIDALEANGGTLTLYKNISITEAMNFAGKSAVINLNGKTLTIGAGDSKFVDETNLTIKNGTVDITGVTVKGNAIFCLDEYEKTLVTTLTLENVDLVGNGYSSAYGIFYIGASSVLNVNGGEWDLANDTFSEGGVFKADGSTAVLNISGLTLEAHNVRRLVTYAATVIENSTIAISGDADGVDAEMEHGFNRSPLTIKNSTVTMENLVGRGITVQNGEVVIEKSTVTITNAQEATIEIKNDSYSVSVDVQSTLTTDGKNAVSNDSSVAYAINTLEDLKWFRDQVNAGNNYSGKYVKLTADIDLNGEEWAPIGNSTTNFQGIFDGGDHVISNLVITGNNSNVGFFGVTSNGEIKNLTINNAKVSGYLNVGVVAGTPYTSKYTNIALTGHVEVDGFAYVGGVGGKNAYANWTNVTVDVDSTSFVKGTSSVYDPTSKYADEDGYVRYRTYVGGVIGFNGEGSHTFTNISSNIAVYGDVCDIGGIFGIAHYGNNFEDVTFTGSVEAPEGATEVGGIAGVWHNEVGQTVTFTDVTSTGTVTVGETTTTGSVVGGAYKPNNEAASNSGSLVIDGKEAWVAVARIGENRYQTLAEAFKAAKNGEEVVIVEAGTYALSTSGKNITITGAVDGVVFEMGGNNVGMNNASITFNNVTFNWAANGWPFHGLAHCGDMVYNNCIFNGTVWLYGTSEIFNECTFNVTGDTYNVWTYGAKKVTFNKCTFNSEGKSVLVYTEDAKHFIDLVVTETTFKASSTVDGKAAIEIDTSISAGANISVDGATTATGFDKGSVSGNTLYNNKKGNEGVNNDINITVNNEVVLEVIKTAEVNGVYYTTIAAALAAAKDGDTVTIFEGTYDYALAINKANLTVIGEGKVTLNGVPSIKGTNYKVENINFVYGTGSTNLSGSGLIKNCTFTATNSDGNNFRYCYGVKDAAITFEGCTLTAAKWAVHFDSAPGLDLTFTDCKINGRIALGGDLGSLTATGTTFENGYVNVWGTEDESSFTKCEFKNIPYVFTGYDVDNIVKFDSCTVVDDDNADAGVSDLIWNGIKDTETKIYIDGTLKTGEAYIGDQYYTYFEDALKAAVDGNTVVLNKDVEISESVVLATSGNITIDGNGYSIKPATDYADKQNAALMLGSTVWGDNEVATHNYTIKNVVFDGFADWSVIRSQGVTLVLDGCTIQNCTQVNGQALIRLDFTEATIKNTVIANNNGLMAICHNFNGDTSTTNLVIDNVVIKNNTFNKIAAVYYVSGGGCTITNSEFVNNTVNCNNNGAVVYLGFQENCAITGCLFEDNKVIDSTASTRVAGAIFFGYEANISGNAFVNNTAANSVGSTLGQICASTYYECAIDLSGNYWGGHAPVAGVDYTLQHQSGDASFVLDSYNASYELDENGNVVVGEATEITYEANIGKYAYATLQDAFDAAVGGDVVVVNYDLVLSGAVVVDGKDITLNLNGKTLSLAGEVATYSLDSVGTVIAAIGGASLKIDGNGNVNANADGGIFYEEDGSNIEIVSGNFHGIDSIDAYLAAGFRAVELEDADGNVYFGVAANDATVYIGTNGNWWVGDYDTGVGAHPVVTIQMVTDRPGYEPGYYWFINGKFSGEAYAVNGINPTITIGADGYWYVDFDGEGVREPVKGESAVAVDGYSVTGIAKDEESSADNIDIYIISYSNGVDTRTSKFIVVNGIDGQQGMPGDKGEQGVQGAPGDKGDPGTNGNSNTWLVEIVVISSVVCILVAVGVVLVLNKKRLNWWA